MSLKKGKIQYGYSITLSVHWITFILIFAAPQESPDSLKGNLGIFLVLLNSLRMFGFILSRLRVKSLSNSSNG